jgi:transcriptional regulator with XRE-family HTH domain
MGLSQEHLGEQVGLTFQQVQKYEKAANRISASRLYRLAQVLNCSPGYFFEGLEENGQLPDVAPDDRALIEFMRSREAIELCMAFVRLEGADQRKAVLALLRSLGENRALSSLAQD